MTNEEITQIVGRLTSKESADDLRLLTERYSNLSNELQSLGKHLQDSTKATKAAEKEVDLLKKVISSMGDDVDKTSADYLKLTDALALAEKKAGSMWRGISDAAMGYKHMIDVVIKKSVEAFELGNMMEFQEQTEKTIRLVGKATGLVGGSMENMSVNLRKALPTVAYFGGEMQDLVDITNALARETGRVQFLTPKDLERVFLMQEALGLSDGEMSEMTDRMQLFGYGAGDAVKSFGELTKSSRMMGLNAKSVVQEMQKNMKEASTISFRNGTEGMMKMAKHAINMRMDMSAILGLAQDLWTPEKAIETAAELQVLGGDFAREFGDPFKLMYAARNEPEKLAQSLEGAIESVYQFNEATGEFEAAPMELHRLREAAGKLGLDFNQLNTSAMQAAKSSMIKGQVSFDADDEQMAFIANVAQMGEGGVATVAIDGKEISISNLTEEQMMELQSTQIESEEEYFQKSMEQYQTQSDALNNIAAQTKALLASSKKNPYLIQELLTKSATQKVAGGVRQAGETLVSGGEAAFDAFSRGQFGEALGAGYGAAATVYQDVKFEVDKTVESVKKATVPLANKADEIGDIVGKIDFSTIGVDFGSLDMNLNVLGLDSMNEDQKSEIFNQFISYMQDSGMSMFNEASPDYTSIKRGE